MDGNTFDSGAPPPQPPSHGAPPPAPAPPPGPPPAQATPPQFVQQPPAAAADAKGSKPGGRSKLFKVFVGLAVLSVASIVFVVGAVVIAISVGVFDQDPVDIDASSQLDQPAVTTGGDGGGEPTTVPPTTPDGVTITWDTSPSSCDGNSKRSFSASVGNATPEALELRMRILDPSNNFVHQSHVYTVPASDQAPVDLGGIPPGESTVQIVDESTDEAIAQTNLTFENC